MSKLSCFNYLGFVIQFEVVIPLTPFFFLKIALGFQQFLRPGTNSRIICSFYVKNAIGIFTDIALNLQIGLKGIDILTILSISIHDHRISFVNFFDQKENKFRETSKKYLNNHTILCSCSLTQCAFISLLCDEIMIN